MSERFFIPPDRMLLDPKIDSIFKTIFTQDCEASRIALKGLVTAIIGYEPEEITVINSEPPKDIITAKDIRLDLNCRMSNGEQINIEMQTCLTDSLSLKARTAYYGCRLVAGLAMHGRDYDRMPKVYQVMFTNFVLFGGSDFLRRFTFASGKEELTDKLQIIFVQLPLVAGKENLQELEKWSIFFRDSAEISKRDVLNRIICSDLRIQKAAEVLMYVSQEERERAIAESRLKWKLDYQSDMIIAERKGVQQGIQQGTLEVAKKMLAEGIPDDVILRVTGLTLEEIRAAD